MAKPIVCEKIVTEDYLLLSNNNVICILNISHLNLLLKLKVSLFSAHWPLLIKIKLLLKFIFKKGVQFESQN